MSVLLCSSVSLVFAISPQYIRDGEALCWEQTPVWCQGNSLPCIFWEQYIFLAFCRSFRPNWTYFCLLHQFAFLLLFSWQRHQIRAPVSFSGEQEQPKNPDFVNMMLETNQQFRAKSIKGLDENGDDIFHNTDVQYIPEETTASLCGGLCCWSLTLFCFFFNELSGSELFSDSAENKKKGICLKGRCPICWAENGLFVAQEECLMKIFAGNTRSNCWLHSGWVRDNQLSTGLHGALLGLESTNSKKTSRWNWRTFFWRTFSWRGRTTTFKRQFPLKKLVFSRS